MQLKPQRILETDLIAMVVGFNLTCALFIHIRLVRFHNKQKLFTEKQLRSWLILKSLFDCEFFNKRKSNPIMH